MKQRANSRLSRSAKKTTASSTELKPIHSEVKQKSRKRVQTSISSSESLKKRYLKQLPTLLVSIPFYFVVYYIITTIQPTAIQHLFIPNTYLPLQVPLFIANFFFFSFLFLKSRRGFLMSFFISLLLFFRLQNIVFEWQWFLLLTGIFIGIEILCSFISAYLAQKKNSQHL